MKAVIEGRDGDSWADCDARMGRVGFLIMGRESKIRDGVASADRSRGTCVTFLHSRRSTRMRILQHTFTLCARNWENTVIVDSRYW